MSMGQAPDDERFMVIVWGKPQIISDVVVWGKPFMIIVWGKPLKYDEIHF